MTCCLNDWIFFSKKLGGALLLGFLSNCRDLVSSKEDFLNLKINFTKIFVKQISRKKTFFSKQRNYREKILKYNRGGYFPE